MALARCLKGGQIMRLHTVWQKWHQSFECATMLLIFANACQDILWLASLQGSALPSDSSA